MQKFKYVEYYSSGRDGIYDILSQRKTQNLSVFLPSYCPEGIIKPFLLLGYDIKFYELDKSFQINIQKLLNFYQPTLSGSIVVVVNYAGIETNIEVVYEKLKSFNIEIWEDFSHLLNLNLELKGVIGFCSLPKIFDVPNGALFFSNKKKIKISKTRFFKIRFSNLFHSIALLLKTYENYSFFRFISRIIFKFINPYKTLNKEFVKPSLMSNFAKYLFKNQDISSLVIGTDNANSFYENNIKNKNIKLSKKKTSKNSIKFGFPIFVNKRSEFVKYLYNFGISAIILEDKWDYREFFSNKATKKNATFFLKQLVLIPNRWLSSKEISYITSIVNKWSSDSEENKKK